jgi:hypothetical protein
LDSLADETMTTGDKNDVGHVIGVWAGEKGEGEERDERRKKREMSGEMER